MSRECRKWTPEIQISWLGMPPPRLDGHAYGAWCVYGTLPPLTKVWIRSWVLLQREVCCTCFWCCSGECGWGPARDPPFNLQGGGQGSEDGSKYFFTMIQQIYILFQLLGHKLFSLLFSLIYFNYILKAIIYFNSWQLQIIYFTIFLP